jgi:NAD(P)-dependent dehydrogenase (short-subunit alcohol dehydrogenase family)
MSLYGSSKAAINLLTKVWAAEYGPSGVRVNAVSPGPTRTEGTDAMGEGLERLQSLDSLTQLKGKRIAVGPEGSGARYVAERILSRAKIDAKTATLLPLAGDGAVEALKTRRRMWLCL